MSWFSPSILETRQRTRVLVTTHGDVTFAGVLWESDDRALVLRNAEVVSADPGAVNVPLDGEVIVLLLDVAYIQRP